MNIRGIFILVFFMLVQGCSSSDSDGVLTLQSDDDIVEAGQTLLGTWSSVNTVNGCEDILEFGELGEFQGTSLDEMTQGDYLVDKDAEGELLLSITITSDNMLSDCAGKSDDDTDSIFVGFLGFPNPDQLKWTELDTEKFLLYQRQSTDD